MHPELIEKVVSAIGIAPGEVVLLQCWGEEEDRKTMHAFAKAVVKQSAAPIGWLQSRKQNADLFEGAAENAFSGRYLDILDPVDTVIDIICYPPNRAGEAMSETAMPAFRAYIRALLPRLMQKPKFVQLRVPTAENAAGSGLEPETFIRLMTEAYDIDYSVVKADCNAYVKKISGKAHATLCTGDNCVLNLSLAGRSWYIDAGDGDLPCGEVYIAPVESETNGQVHFDELSLEDGLAFEDLTLTVQDGIVTGSNSATFTDLLAGLPPNGTTVCELGVGMNPGVTSLVGFQLLDEKMRGTFHIALGMNLPFGGQNESPSHIDLVGRGTLEFS